MISKDYIKTLERKNSLFTFVVSLWSHTQLQKEATGCGFTNSIFTYKEGTGVLYHLQNEINDLNEYYLNLIKNHDPKLKEWYEKSKKLNQQADELLTSFSNENLSLENFSYEATLKTFSDHFTYSTVIPFYILAAIGSAIEKGESKESFLAELKMFEELRGQTRYPQLVTTVLSKFFDQASQIVNISKDLVEYLTPNELEFVLNKTVITLPNLESRKAGCVASLGGKLFEVNFDFQNIDGPSTISDQKITEFKGNSVFQGVAKGRVKIVNTAQDIIGFQTGDILVSINTSPSLISVMKEAGAIVTNEGGITSHAAIIARELKIPCVIGTKIATKVLKDGDLVEVDADHGIVRIIK